MTAQPHARAAPQPKRRRLLSLLAAPLLAPLALQAGNALAQERIDARSHGLVLLLRHASTEPGNGDPPGYSLANCASQRKLSPAGQAQARALGVALAARGLRPTAVKSSRWCRCLDTARLAFGTVQPWPALDSFFDDRSSEPAQTAALRAALAALRPGEMQVWVSHMVNIAALTGEGTAMGAGVLLRGGLPVDAPVQVLERLAAQG